MKPWMKRIESNAIPAMRQLRCASLIAGACSPMPVIVIADMSVSYAVRSGDSVGLGSAGVGLEPVVLKDREGLWGVDEGEPQTRRLGVRRALHFRAGVDRRRVLAGRDVDMGDRVSRLLLEHRFGLPGDARLGAPLHEEEWRLAMVDVSEDRAAVGHL